MDIFLLVFGFVVLFVAVTINILTASRAWRSQHRFNEAQLKINKMVAEHLANQAQLNVLHADFEKGQRDTNLRQIKVNATFHRTIGDLVEGLTGQKVPRMPEQFEKDLDEQLRTLDGKPS